MKTNGFGRIETTALLTALLMVIGTVPAQAGKEIIGWVQQASVFPENFTLRARIDSGADAASINAQHMQRIYRDGEPWVRFTLTNAKGKAVTLERPEIGRVKIKRHSEGPQTRPVVMLRLCLGGITRRTPVNLADRSGYNYQLLIGRHFLAHDFLIDPGARFLHVPRCTADVR